jgi:hypothetical protein
MSVPSHAAVSIQLNAIFVSLERKREIPRTCSVE